MDHVPLIGDDHRGAHVEVPFEQAGRGGKPLVAFAQEDQHRHPDLVKVVDDVGVEVHRDLLGSRRDTDLHRRLPYRLVPLVARLGLTKARSGGHQHQTGNFVGMVHGVGQGEESAKAMPHQHGRTSGGTHGSIAYRS